MKERVYLIAAVVSGTLAVSGCTTNPYTGEHEAGESAIGTGLGSLVGASIGALSSSEKDRGKSALIGAVTGVALGGDVGYYMNMQEMKLRNKMRSTGISIAHSGGNTILNMLNSVTFNNSSATLKPAGADALTGMTMVLKEYPRTAVNVISYINSTGGRDLNIRLSRQCMGSVTSALITQGVDAGRIRTQSLGPINSITSNSTAKGKAQNCRIEITLSPL